MSLHPPSLTPVVLRDLARNLQKQISLLLPSRFPLNRAQEMLASILNHEDWHAALTHAEQYDAAPDSPPTSHLDISDIRNSLRVCTIDRQVLLEGDCLLEGHEIVEEGGLLPVLLWECERKTPGIKFPDKVVLSWEDGAWCMAEVSEMNWDQASQALRATVLMGLRRVLEEGLLDGGRLLSQWHSEFMDALLNDGLSLRWTLTTLALSQRRRPG